MRIPKDDRPGEIQKLKGFGYVEFQDREGLLSALAIPDCVSCLLFIIKLISVKQIICL